LESIDGDAPLYHAGWRRPVLRDSERGSVRLASPTGPPRTTGCGLSMQETAMLALNPFGTKEIIVYAVVVVVIIAGWFFMRGRSRG
jgi:hypothetical protein